MFFGKSIHDMATSEHHQTPLLQPSLKFLVFNILKIK